jgi:hypothetical protein
MFLKIVVVMINRQKEKDTMNSLVVGVNWCNPSVFTPLHLEIKRCKGVITLEGYTFTPNSYTSKGHFVSCQGLEVRNGL